MANSKKLSTEPYKGVRDFYPEDKFVQNWMFKKIREIVRGFGYEEYNASILELSDIYKAKTGEEIVNEQTYTFKDRGKREVTLRPEMTPTVARMVAAKSRELNFPLRWFSIPNLFRYERPQKGRLREHYQLNVDIFGSESVSADVEVIFVAYKLLISMGAEEKDFVIKINSRRLLDWFFNDYLGLEKEEAYKLSKIIDKKSKLQTDEFKKMLYEVIGDKTDTFVSLLDSESLEDFDKKTGLGDKALNIKEELEKVFDSLSSLGVSNFKFDISVVRGLDYYNGVVFEFYDTDPENNRSLLGGGRYDGLTEIFSSENIPAVGFGFGDVTLFEFLKSRNLLPKYRGSSNLFICTLAKEFITEGMNLAEKLREQGLKVEVNLTNKKIGDQVSLADKKKIPYIICIGEDEVKSGKFKIKELESGEERKLTTKEITDFIKSVQ